MDDLIKYSVTLFQASDKLRVSSLFQLLIGKRTSSVLTFGFFNNLLNHFGLFPKLKEVRFYELINELVNCGYIEKVEPGMFKITQQGVAFVADNPVNIENVNGVKYSSISNDYLELLFFATQIISEYSFKNSHYMPLIDTNYRQYKMKQWFLRNKKNVNALPNDFYQEWLSLISEMPENVAEPIQMINLLSGNNQIGQTFNQVFNGKNANDITIYLKKVNISHYVVRTIESQEQKYPLFFDIYKEMNTFTGNHSARESYSLSKQGQSVEKIMGIRKLKRSTVVEHLIEGLILDENPYDLSIIGKKDYVFLKDFEHVHSDYKTWVFKELKDEKQDLIFFSFRAYQITKMKGGE